MSVFKKWNFLELELFGTFFGTQIYRARVRVGSKPQAQLQPPNPNLGLGLGGIAVGLGAWSQP